MAIIIGALAIIGLLAIIGVVLLLQGGDRAQATRSTPPPVVATDVPESEHPATPLNGSLPVPAAPTDGRAPQRETANEVSVLQHTPSIERDDEQHIMLNGQFYELVDQLRTLHEQSVEIEQRLNSLNQMVERVSQRQATNK